MYHLRNTCDMTDEIQVNAALVQLFGKRGAAVIQRALEPSTSSMEPTREETRRSNKRRVTRVRKSVLAYAYAPKRKLFQIVVSMDNVPGALGRVLGALSKRVNLISSMSSSSGGEATWSAFAEPTSLSETTSSLEELLSSVPDVRGCSAQEGKEGLLIDRLHSGVDIGGPASYMLMRREPFSSVLGEVLKVFGRGGEILLFNEGRKYGVLTGELLRNLMGREGAKQRTRELLGIFNSLGWGEVSVKESHGPVEFVLEARDCFECSSPETGARSCSFMLGNMVGAVSTIRGDEYSGTETKCRFRGSDCCEFRLVLRSGT